MVCESNIIDHVDENFRNFGLQGCSANGKTVVCHMLITPQQDESIIIDATMPDAQSTLFDSSLDDALRISFRNIPLGR